MGLSTYEEELWTIIFAVNKWRYYLYGCPFLIKTDHQSLSSCWSSGWLPYYSRRGYLVGLCLYHCLQKRAENIAADSLSHAYEDYSCQAISVLQPAWLHDLAQSWKRDDAAHTLISKHLISPNTISDYSWSFHTLRYQGCTYVGSSGPLRSTIWQESHNSSMGGTLG